jgi:glyoxylase-like metal-dependent hydrolase (beta-lactamase superfamily II)
LTQGKGHTESDAYLILPGERIMFMGDLGFFQCQPFMVFADLPSWEAQLTTFLGSGIETFVPGHGMLGRISDITLMLEYFDILEELVSRVVEEGKPVETALQQNLPPPFKDWQASSSTRFERNVEALYQKITNSKNNDQAQVNT